MSAQVSRAAMVKGRQVQAPATQADWPAPQTAPLQVVSALTQLKLLPIFTQVSLALQPGLHPETQVLEATSQTWLAPQPPVQAPLPLVPESVPESVPPSLPGSGG